MERLSLQLLFKSLIFISATAIFCSDKYNDSSNRYRLPDNVIPEHYNIKLEPYFETEGKSFNFSGRCEAYVKIISPTWCISLHAQKPQIEIQHIIVINTELLYASTPINVTYNKETHILIFHFNYELSNGHYLLNMSFIGLADNDGYFFRTPYHINHNKRWFVATQFRTIGARQLFPCWDEPAFKATFNITVRHQIRYLAVSSMPIQKQYSDDNDNIVTTHFRMTNLMSTYLVTLALYDTNLAWLIQSPTKDQSLLLQELKFARNIIYSVINRFIDESQYSEDLSYVHHFITPASPRHNGNGIILYKVANVFYNETLDPVSQKMKAACIIAYEVSRQWFNNLISPSWWSDYWLNEGVARLLGMDIINNMFQGSHMLDLFAVQNKQECLYLDHFKSGIMNPLISEVKKSSEIDSLLSFSYYIKDVFHEFMDTRIDVNVFNFARSLYDIIIAAPVILLLLQELLTDEVFQHGYEIFLDKHKFDSATIDDFWSAMQVAQNLRNISDKGFNVTKMKTWTKQKHFPVLKITFPEECVDLIISVENSLAKDKWYIPISIFLIEQTLNVKTFKNSYYWEGELGISSVPSTLFYIALPCKKYELIIANSQAGYYRVNYDTEYWLKIAKYLNEEGYMNIHVHNRAQIIDDAFYFLSMGQLNMLTFFELTKYLSQDTNYVVWYPMIKALERMSSFFPILSGRVILFKKHMQEILDKVLQQIGYEESSEEDYPIKCLRQEVAKWACTLEDPKCLQMAKDKLEQHVIEHKKLLPWWREWTYCKGVMAEENLTGIWNTILQTWISNPNDRIFEFLTCIAHPNSIKMYLNENNPAAVSLRNITLKIRDVDRVYIFLFTIIKHANNDEILEYILNNFEELKPREVNTVLVLIIIINHVYSDSQLQKIRRFVAKYLTQHMYKILKYTYTLIKNSFLHKEYNKLRESLNNLINQQISFMHRKIETRINEIKLLRQRITDFVTF